MPIKLAIIDVIPRCLAATCRCLGEENNPQADLAMKDEFRAIAREVSRWQLSGESKARHFLRPMEKELVNRYGATIGRRLYWDFVEAFWIQSWTSEPIVPPKLEWTIAM
jgi:hypothetical protein